VVVFVQASGLLQGFVGALGKVLQQGLRGTVQPRCYFGLVPKHVG
jgi:hypothetical protein